MHRRSFASEGTFDEVEPEGRASVCSRVTAAVKEVGLATKSTKNTKDRREGKTKMNIKKIMAAGVAVAMAAGAFADGRRTD